MLPTSEPPVLSSPPFDASAWLELLRRYRAIAVIRADQLERGLAMAQAVAAAGLELIEITWNSDRPVELVQQLRQALPQCAIGAGTLKTADQLQAAIAAGAQFCFTPHTSPDLIRRANAQGIPIIPGALSPTELLTAWQAGAASVKVFPIAAVGGAAYLRHLQGPLGEIPLIPTGGVTLENATQFLEAGAIAVGLAGDLFPAELVAQQDWTAISHRTASLLNRLHR